MSQPASEPDLELTLSQRAAKVTALTLGQRRRHRVRPIQSRAVQAALVVMMLAIASLAWFSLRLDAPRHTVVDSAMGVSFDLPAGWRRVEARQFTPFLQENYHWVPDSLLQEIADHLSHPEYGLVLVPVDSLRPFIVISKRDIPAAPLTQLSPDQMLEAELVHFTRPEMGPVRVIERQGGSIFSRVSTISLDSHRLLVRHDSLTAGENALVVTWVGPDGGNARVLDGLSGSLGVASGLAGGRWLAAGMVQLWLLTLVVGMASVALQIYRRMG